MDIHVSPQIERLIRDALDEDIGAGDLATMATISAECQGKALFRAKKDGVVAGLVLLERIFYFIDHRVGVHLLAKDGTEVKNGTVVAEVVGPVRALLLAERTALNFLQRLSGTATLTRKLVEAV
ncbi:MAG: nadC, partial [Deltaproteobacteria bacterium]|nr:nadC [Deltaproteobacteria bacterium]